MTGDRHGQADWVASGDASPSARRFYWGRRWNCLLPIMSLRVAKPLGDLPTAGSAVEIWVPLVCRPLRKSRLTAPPQTGGLCIQNDYHHRQAVLT